MRAGVQAHCKDFNRDLHIKYLLHHILQMACLKAPLCFISPQTPCPPFSKRRPLSYPSSLTPKVPLNYKLFPMINTSLDEKDSFLVQNLMSSPSGCPELDLVISHQSRSPPRFGPSSLPASETWPSAVPSSPHYTRSVPFYIFAVPIPSLQS